MAATFTVTAEKHGVFMEWLKNHPDASVTILNDNNVDESDEEDPEEEESNPEESQEQDSQVDEYINELKKAREDRLKQLTTWNAEVNKFGPYTVKLTANGVRIAEIKARLCEMEDASALDALGRFTKYTEEGYILIRNVFNDPAGQALLKKVRKAMARLAMENWNVQVDVDTMECVVPKEQRNKVARLTIDYTEQVLWTLNEEQDKSQHDTPEETLSSTAMSVLHSPHLAKLMDEFQEAANYFHSKTPTAIAKPPAKSSSSSSALANHKPNLLLNEKYEWARLRGRAPPRKEFAEYYFLRGELDDNPSRWDRRYAREILKRKDGSQMRYGFSVYVAVGPNPMDGGGLSLLPGSHLLPGFTSNRKDEEVPAHFKKQATGMPWVASDLNPGDVLIVDMQTARAYISNKRSPYFLMGCVDSMYTLGAD